MKPASGLAVIDQVPDPLVRYDVVLLAGSPKRLSLQLAADLAPESVIDVDGEQWTVADVRPGDGVATQLICIYAV